MPMKIVVVHTDAQARAGWLLALRRLLPAARIVADGSPDASGASDADYAVGWTPPEGFFREHPRLRAFFSAAAGVDHLLRHPQLPPDLPIIRLEDAGMARQMIDYCRHEVLHVAGRHGEYRALQAQGRWHELDAIAPSELPIGVVGLGVLGAQVAQALAADGWTVNGHARSARRIDGVRVFHGPAGWDGFLAATRLLILLAPLTAETADLVDARALARLQPGGWLVNVARGGLVVDADLVAALDRGHLAGATLDVFREEPLPAGHPFWTHPRIRVTPHVAAVTRVAESAAQVAGKLLLMERGERPGGWVERDRGY
jgi:glyoxylate/hydroxypyruvate reductase